MSRPGFVFIVAILAIGTLLPMATSAGPSRLSATPTPVIRQIDNQSLFDGDSRAVGSVTMTEGLAGNLGGVLGPQNAEGEYDPQQLEAFRQDLLDLADALEALYPYAEAYAQATGKTPPSLVSRSLIRSLTYEQLAIVRNTFGDAYEPFQQDIQELKSTVLSWGQETSEGARPVRPASSSASLNAGSSATSPPTSIGIIPAPTPVTTPPPGITHQDQENTNSRLGDLPTPNYPTSVGCPTTRFPNPATLATLIATAVAKEVDDFADEAGCEGTFFVVAVPFGGGSNLPGCLGWAVLKYLMLAASAVDEGLNFCIGRIDAAELEAARQDTIILHAELAMHDRNLTGRFNTTDQFLFHFRNINLRSRIEANLASVEDDPIAMFYLPRRFCIRNDLELKTNPNSTDYDPFAPEVIAGCGLLEVVSDTVRSAIDMTINSGQSINNAETEFQAAVNHYNNQQWKLAYDRFRKAYREVMKP
jgi:hypothetical protein